MNQQEQDDAPRRDFITFREAVSMFASKAEFEKFATRMETKLDQVLSGQLPRWFWYAAAIVVTLIAGLIGPVVAALLTHVINTRTIP